MALTLDQYKQARRWLWTNYKTQIKSWSNLPNKAQMTGALDVPSDFLTDNWTSVVDTIGVKSKLDTAIGRTLTLAEAREVTKAGILAFYDKAT